MDTTYEFSDAISGSVFTQDYSSKIKIEGLQIIDLARFTTDEGDFGELIRLNEQGELESIPGFKLQQVNRTRIFPGSVKAWHVHKRQDEVWYISPYNQLFVGLWDVRKGSPTEGATMRVTIGGGKSHMLLIPKGVAHGNANFSEEQVELFYLVTQKFNVSEPDELRLHWDAKGKDFWTPERLTINDETPHKPLNMVIKKVTDLGEVALANPKKYNAFLGVSIRNNYFSLKKMDHYFNWMSHQFKSNIVFLLDDSDRYNYMVFQDEPEEIALKKARAMGEDKKRSYERLLRKLTIKNIEVILFQQIFKEEKYQNILGHVRRYMDMNNTFKEHMISILDMAIGGKFDEHIHLNQVAADKKDYYRKLLFEYVIQEYAVLIYLTELGYPIEIDPYEEFTCKKYLYENMFADLSSILNITQRGHLFAHPEGMEYSKEMKKTKAIQATNSREANV